MAILFYVYYFYMGIISSAPTGNVFPEFTLNISELQPGTRVQVYNYGGVEYSSYNPESNGSFSKVMEGDKDIWDSENGGRCLDAWTHNLNGYMVLRLVINLPDGLNRFFFFEKVDGEWQDIDSTSYAEKVEAILKSNSDSIMVDGSNPDYVTCDVIRYSKYNISNFVGCPFIKFKLRKLLYKNFTIWESDDFFCVHFALAISRQRAICEIHITNENMEFSKLYFSFFESFWISVTHEEFLTMNSLMVASITSEDLKKQRYAKIETEGNMDPRRCSISMYRMNTAPVIDIKPHPEYIINEVTSMSKPIWKGADDERCLNVKKIIYPNGLTLVSLFIRDFTGYKRKYFQRRDFYEDMTEEEYNEKVMNPPQ